MFTCELVILIKMKFETVSRSKFTVRLSIKKMRKMTVLNRKPYFFWGCHLLNFLISISALQTILFDPKYDRSL